MKKTITLILTVFLLSPILVLAVTETADVSGSVETIDPRGATTFMGKSLPSITCIQPMGFGAAGPQVKDLQNILKSDPAIYPEGLVTGNYGSLTKEAVKRLQKEFGLLQTGEIDQSTGDVIMPCEDDVRIMVLSPNGGETWDKNEIHKITWKLERRVYMPGSEEEVEDGDDVATETPPDIIPPTDIREKWFWPKGRIDLISGDGTFVRHIATVNLANQSYSWKIDKSIPNGSDYKIRIGIGPVLGCADGERCPISWHSRFTWGDESDDVFTITGETPPAPDKIGEAIGIVQDLIKSLNKLLTLLESLR